MKAFGFLEGRAKAFVCKSRARVHSSSFADISCLIALFMLSHLGQEQQKQGWKEPFAHVGNNIDWV